MNPKSLPLDKKAGRYARIYDQLKELLQKPGNDISRMATVAAVLSHKMDYFFWTGFYLLDNGELIAGPYQGPVACQLLKKNTGVCWEAINTETTIVVPNVHLFPGHIACDSRSNSEIVVPLRNAGGDIIGVLDVDSKEVNSFDDTDREWLEKIVSLLYSR
ncbi:MAG TPA: GAF domain-containing protein [Bacteroidales bacterium]|nr:GAF domain-containing protein [Bacteroidales bacterium]